MAVIRCDECGRTVDFDEDLDGPVPHVCNEYDPDSESLSELDFDDGSYVPDMSIDSGC